MNYVLTENAVGKIRRAIAPRSGNTGAIAATGLPIDPDKFPPPFTVRWSASANSGAGAWLIWLPATSNLLLVNGSAVTIGGVTAAQNMPPGWYTIDDLDGNSTEVYLVITVDDATSAATAELLSAAGQTSTGETVYNVKVADITTDATTGAKSVKQYTDSVVVFAEGKPGEAGADAGIVITQEPITPSTDHPGGGVQLTFQPTKGGLPDGQPTIVTLWNGSGGGGGGADLSNTPALDVVPSTGQASAGVAVTASRQDHVHKMPATVVLTDTAQTITGSKTFSAPITLLASNGKTATIQYGVYGGSAFLSIGEGESSGAQASAGNVFFAQGDAVEIGARGNSGASGDSPNLNVLIGSAAHAHLLSIAPAVADAHAASLKWVDNNYQRKITTKTQKVLTDITWNTTTHRLVKHYKTLTVLDTANESDAYIETTAISSIIPQSS